MASITSSSAMIRNTSLQVPDKYFNPMVSDRFSKKKGLVAIRKRDVVRGLTVTSVATPSLPKTSPPLKSGDRRDHSSHVHVAWTSVRQERWEGELVVHGEIPLWLVCKNYLIIIIIYYLLAGISATFLDHWKMRKLML